MQSFGTSVEEMVHIWILFCRSVIEQSCVVWGTSLTQENIDDLERTQKTFTKLVLREKYKDYENALLILNLDSLPKKKTRHVPKVCEIWDKEWKTPGFISSQ